MHAGSGKKTGSLPGKRVDLASLMRVEEMKMTSNWWMDGHVERTETVEIRTSRHNTMQNG